jgi:hypothetical protein
VSKTFFTAVAAIAVCGSAQAADFSYAQGSGQRYLEITTYSPGQAFTATNDTKLTSFGFQLTVANAGEAADDVFLYLYEGADYGTIEVATATATPIGLAAAGQLGWVDFDLTGTTLTAGATYSAFLGTGTTRYGLVFGPDVRLLPAPAQPVPGASDIYAGGALLAAGFDDRVCDTGLCDANFRFSAEPAAAPVPEPASWAMMVGGFALVGSSLRRRRWTVRFA